MNIVKPRKNNNLTRTEQLIEEIKDEELINKQIGFSNRIYSFRYAR